ncbi:PEP-CTERM sorting domain-containing protein [Granulicella sp. S190]|uniref:PEP-CTERM sorting domain-containing protein n=1 Tax=Granulicella sp. S190 TaxID=1747226 RepID=UPI00131E5D48|nr:PEP-CTERM sorting domain-containing protein [Granulicella sp. S190]
MTRLSLALCTLVMAALPTTAALADSVSFNFSFSNADFSGSGVLTADSTNIAGVYDIVGVSGDIVIGKTTDAISGLLAAGVFPADGPNDNLLYFPELPAPFGAFDASGVSFTLANGAGKVNLFLSEGEVLKLTGGKQDEELGSISVEASPVPEPGSLTLLGTGALGLAEVVRRRLSA